MKEKYVSAQFEVIIFGTCDVITASDPNSGDPIVGTGPIGGGGMDDFGWT